MANEVYEIKVGDEVTVHFWPMYNDIIGVVRCLPSVAGDSWIIESKDGAVHYVQHFASITSGKKDKTK